MQNSTKNTVRVWDLPTRLFHWLLVILVLCAWLSHEFGDLEMVWHTWNGYALITLILFRLLWGLVGSTTARFSDFLAGPGRILAYLRSGAHAVGHNPLGGWMVILLLVLVGMQGITGLFTDDEVLFSGPLAHLVSSDWVERLSALHELGFNLIIAAVVLHVTAIVFYRLFKRVDLVRPMLTGRKPADEVPADARLSFAPLGLAVICLAVAAGVLALVLWLA